MVIFFNITRLHFSVRPPLARRTLLHDVFSSSFSLSASLSLPLSLSHRVGRRQQAQHTHLRHPRTEGQQAAVTNLDHIRIVYVIAERAQLHQSAAAAAKWRNRNRAAATDSTVRLHCRGQQLPGAQSVLHRRYIPVSVCHVWLTTSVIRVFFIFPPMLPHPQVRVGPPGDGI